MTRGDHKTMPGLRALAEPVAAIVAPLLRTRGFATGGRILTDWPSIVGERLAARSVPEKLVRGRGGEPGTLHVRIAAGGLALELQHLQPLLLERINSYFGYAAVGRLRLLQGPLPARPPQPPAPQPPPPAVVAAVDGYVGRVENPKLRQALAALGVALFRAPAAPGPHDR